MNNVQLGITVVLALFTIGSYFLTRRRELAWRRTEFLCRQSEYLDSDPVLLETITILENRHPELTISAIFAPEAETTALDSRTRQQYLQKFDKLLNLLWRLCYAFLETKTISIKELDGFGWYLWKISKNPALVAYCEENGF